MMQAPCALFGYTSLIFFLYSTHLELSITQYVCKCSNALHIIIMVCVVD